MQLSATAVNGFCVSPAVVFDVCITVDLLEILLTPLSVLETADVERMRVSGRGS